MLFPQRHRSLLLGAASVALMGCTGDKVAGGSADGKVIYKEACARCHGTDGVPTQGMRTRAGVKPLTSERVKKMSDEKLTEQIRNGSENRTMPAFQGSITEEQMDALLGHIRVLQEKPADELADL
ncbi:MAG: cytochrome c [Myxococcales bacterium]|nr:cytochrome c [Myxococcales bacterium]